MNKRIIYRLGSWMTFRELTPIMAIVGILVIFFLSQIIAVNIVAIVGAIRGMNETEIIKWIDESTPARFGMYLMIGIVGLIFVNLMLKKYRISWSDIGLKHPVWKDGLYALAGYGWYLPLYIVSALFISKIFPVVDLSQKQQLGFDLNVSGAGLIFTGLSLVLIPAVYEEILFRGVLFTGLRKKLSLIVSMIVVSGMFAIAHLEWSAQTPLLWAAAVDTFILSIILVYMREKTGSLWPCIGLHAIKNSVAFAILFVFKVA